MSERNKTQTGDMASVRDAERIRGAIAALGSLLPWRGAAATLHGKEASHDEETCTPVPGLCRRRLSGYGPHGWRLEPAALERAAVGGGCLGRRHRADRLVGVEPVEGEEGCPMKFRRLPERAGLFRESASHFLGNPCEPHPGRQAPPGRLACRQSETGCRFTL